MVMLDEAFTRIDDEGRRGIMGLISKFDLDIMLTSPDYWGCCAEVPELDIYVLAPRDPSAPGVVARHFHWDGERRALVDDPPSRHGNGKVELIPQLDDGQLDLDGHAAGGQRSRDCTDRDATSASRGSRGCGRRPARRSSGTAASAVRRS